jgi:hypothetical protein
MKMSAYMRREPNKREHERKKSMDINAYVFAMPLTGMARYFEKQRAVPEPEFKPFDLRHLRSPSVNSSQQRPVSRRNGEFRPDVFEALSA